MRFYNSIAFVGSAASYVGLCVLTTGVQHRTLAVILFTLAGGILGCNAGSFFKSVPLVAQVYSGFVMGIVQFVTSVVILALPFIVGPIVAEGGFAAWRYVFGGVAIILLLTNLVFCFLGSGHPAAWAAGTISSESSVVSQPSDTDASIPVTTVNGEQSESGVVTTQANGPSLRDSNRPTSGQFQQKTVPKRRIETAV